MKNLWKKTYAYVVPTVAIIIYGFLIKQTEKTSEVILIQNSQNVDKMLNGYITFTSIILSVFGFLMPNYVSSRTRTREYFQKHADMRAFANALQHVVVMGLFSVIMSCFLFLYDLFSRKIQNLAFFVWIWIVLHFAFSAYRYISILIRIIFVDQDRGKFQIANPPDDFVKDVINKHVGIYNEDE